MATAALAFTDQCETNNALAPASKNALAIPDSNGLSLTLLCSRGSPVLPGHESITEGLKERLGDNVK
jgi:hypothetical protein